MKRALPCTALKLILWGQLPTLQAGAPCTGRGLQQTLTVSRRFADLTETPGGCPTATPASNQAPEHPHGSIADYHRFADLYLGGLWNRFEAGLRQQEGESFDYNVELTSGCMRVTLPDSAAIVICKDPKELALVVESNLHDLSGGGDPRDAASFRLDEEGKFVDGGESLHAYLEDHLAKHLKVQVDLDPTGQGGAPDKLYGPE